MGFVGLYLSPAHFVLLMASGCVGPKGNYTWLIKYMYLDMSINYFGCTI